MSLLTVEHFKKIMKKETYSRTRTLYTMKSWPTDINVYDDERVWWFRNHKRRWVKTLKNDLGINRSVAWQCFDADQYYFKTEEDLKAYLRDQNLDKLL
jgi:hypothetical protein